MPVKIGSKRYKGHNSAAKAIARKKGISMKSAHKYVGKVESLIKKRRAAKRKRKS
jgi:hypothetical protein